jgi:hypothetical protein
MFSLIYGKTIYVKGQPEASTGMILTKRVNNVISSLINLSRLYIIIIKLSQNISDYYEIKKSFIFLGGGYICGVCEEDLMTRLACWLLPYQAALNRYYS